MFFLLSLLSPAFPATPEPASIHAAVPIAIEVSGAYQPDRITVSAGQPVTLVFTRTTWDGCTREVVFPTLGIRKELPTNQPTPVELPALAPGEYTFSCGMHMISGTLVVK